MELVDNLVEIFKEGVHNVFAREQAEPKYMRQTILGCRWRAFKGILAMIRYSFPRMVKVLAYAIAKHRAEKHGEVKKEKTMQTLEKGMSTDDIAKASTRSGWVS